ncbi:MAG: sialidase family protein [Opitutaceae bacterium]
MERFIAIDNVCAWPNLTRMADGTLIATIFNQPTHGGWEGDVECWASRDEGRTWKLRGVPAPHEPGTNRMNVAAGLAGDGALVVIASGWSRRNKPGNYSSAHEGEVLTPWVCRSEDGGITWKRTGSVKLPRIELYRGVPFGDVVRHADGALGVCIYGGDKNGNHSEYFTSDDDGLNWRRKSVIEGDSSNETAPLVLPDGTLLAAARTRTDSRLELHRSRDQGCSWEALGALTLAGQIPGHLLRLADGRILLSFGMRNKGMHGVGVRLSSDSGETWGAPRVIVNYHAETDGGYPSSVQVEDGTIVTAYYCGGIETHQRYHMGVVRWKAE